jgi:hypothetical protein
LTTDALALTGGHTRVFAALSTTLKRDGKKLVESKEPITFKISKNSVKSYLAKQSTISIGLGSRLLRVMLNRKRIRNFKNNEKKKQIVLTLPAGENSLSFKTQN